MRWVFWLSALFVVYVYAGYPLLLMLWARIRRHRNPSSSFVPGHRPSVSIIVAARNEAQRLRAQGLSDSQIGAHGGAADTSLMLDADASMVRSDRLAVEAARSAAISGDPARASAAIGRIGTDLIVQQTVAAIRQAIAR